MGGALRIQPSPAIAPRLGLPLPLGRSSTPRLAYEIAHGPLHTDPATMPVIMAIGREPCSAQHWRLGATRLGHISPIAAICHITRD